MRVLFNWLTFLTLCSLLAGCGKEPLNTPYPDDPDNTNTFYTAFTEPPKHLDPARSYNANEWAILNQIYEPPLQYHYLKRPYVLEPLVASQMPTVEYTTKQGQNISIYTIHIQSGIYYQPHPAFAKNSTGDYLYLTLDPAQASEVYSPQEFPQKATRELTANDFVYQIKRLASPKTQSPIFGLMGDYIIGLEDLRQTLKNTPNSAFLDLRNIPFEGATVVDRYTYQITLKGTYPQFIYWLAMPFFAPMPWEVDQFYQQPAFQEHNLTLDWYPVGTGPYQMIENNPNYRIILERNPQYHGELYPNAGEKGDDDKGLLQYAGKPIPFIDRIVLSLEKESVPHWTKFLQGYYDVSGVSSDSFDQAFTTSGFGGLALSPEMEAKGIRIETSVDPTIFYWGFNMRDPVVGGNSLRAKKLRKAISIAIDEEEYIQIFLNGRGLPAYTLIPPGVSGGEEAPINEGIYQQLFDGSFKRRPIQEAKTLLAEAGYPNGIDPATHKSLVLYLDDVADATPDSKSEFTWIQKQFNKIGIQLIVRSTQYNRFQEKMQHGAAQIFKWGWHADYPDAENFLFLLYGPNAKAIYGGENATNYQNPQFDVLFQQMRKMLPGPERNQLITQMIHYVQEDSPWIMRFYPKAYTLSHQWLSPGKPNALSYNTLKYRQVDPNMRSHYRFAWNKPHRWPVVVFFCLMLLSWIPAQIYYFHKTFWPPKLRGSPSKGL